MSGSPQKSDFTAAEEIKSLLSGREPSEQERILRWVAESLGIQSGVRLRPINSSGPGPDLDSGAIDAAAPAALSATPTRDIRSYVQEKQPRSDNQLVTVIAYFYRFVAPEADRKDPIGTEDVQRAARHARGSGFKAPSTTLNNAVQQGYLDSAGRGQYRINAVGENLVAMALPSKTGAVGAGTGSTRRAKKKSKRKG